MDMFQGLNSCVQFFPDNYLKVNVSTSKHINFTIKTSIESMCDDRQG